MEKIKVAVILPAFNEEVTIQRVMLDFHRNIPGALIFVVDNNSTDQTKKIALDTFKTHGIKGEVIFESLQGKGYAIKRAFTSIDADFYIMADSDATYTANSAIPLLNCVSTGLADISVGDRMSRGYHLNKRRFHEFGNKFIISTVNYIFKSELKDILSGLRVFNRKFVKNYPVLIGGFELETDITIYALDRGFTIKEYAIDYLDRPSESLSKLNTFKDGMKIIKTILKLSRYYRPLFFFTITSIFFAALAFISSLPVISDWVIYRYIYHIPMAILATGLSLVSIILLISGIILDSIHHHNIQEFQRSLLNK